MPVGSALLKHIGQGTRSWRGFDHLLSSYAHGFDLYHVAWKAAGGAIVSGSALD